MSRFVFQERRLEFALQKYGDDIHCVSLEDLYTVELQYCSNP